MGKTQTGVFPIAQSLMKENCHNSRTSEDIVMKLGPVTKLDKRSKTGSKKLSMTTCQQIEMSLSFFRFMTNLEKCESRIPDAWSVKLTFSLIVTFSLCVYLRTKFQVSSIILTSFRRGNFSPPPQNEPLKSPSRSGLKTFFHKMSVRHV